MARKIAEGVGDVHVTNPETGEVVVLHPGDTVPSKLENSVGEHVTTSTGRRSSRADVEPAGPSQTPEGVAAAKAAQEKADADGEAASKAEGEKQEKADADAAALKAAEDAEAAKTAAAKKSGGS